MIYSNTIQQTLQLKTMRSCCTHNVVWSLCFFKITSYWLWSANSDFWQSWGKYIYYI